MQRFTRSFNRKGGGVANRRLFENNTMGTVVIM